MEDQEEEGSDLVYEDEALVVIPLDDDRASEDAMQEDMEELEVEEDEDVSTGPLKDDATYCFNRHSGSVFSVSLHPSGEVACSGGEDDMAFVWKVQDGSLLFHCHGHKDSVTCTGFSHDGKYVATADMGGLVQVWTLSTGKLACSFETSDLEWLQWHDHAHVVLVGTSDGGGWMWKVPSGDCKTFQGPSCRNTCTALTSDGKQACFGYEDGSVRVWDLKQGTTLNTITGHTSTVTSMAAHTDNNLILTGSEDSTASLISTNTGKVVATFAAGFPSEEQGEGPPSVEAVGFCPSLSMAVTGSLSGVVAIWDVPSQRLRHQCKHEAGVTRLHCSSSGPFVFSSCLDGVVRLWDLRSGQCVEEWQGHTNNILDMAVAMDDSVIVTGSDDHTARVFSRQTR